MLLKDKMSDFSKGFTISLGSDMLAGLVLDKLDVKEITTTDIEEWLLDASVEGIKEAFMPKGGKYHKHASAGVECLVGVDVFETIENIESEKPIDDIIVETFIDCSVSVLIDALVNADKVSNAINKLRNAGTDKIIAALRKLSFISPEDEITFLSKVCKVHDEYWMNKMQSVLRTEGIAGFDFLKDISFDYTKLSINNFERLSRIVSKAKASPEAIEMFKNLLSQGRDANRMIKHIDDMGCSVDEYTTIIGKLLDSNEFKKTITIKGKKMNVKEFFLNDNIDAVSWYYKRDDYYLTYYKVWEGETKECLKITFEIVDGSITNIASESVKTVIKEAIKDETENN
jgi:hypothetical protein